MMKLINC